jgi:aspartate aminotransferase-like enzyme
MIKKELGLRIPGPTPIPPSVLQAMQQPMVSHRGTEFTDIVASLQGDLRYLFQTENDCLILAGSGTAAMEATVANLVAPGRPVLVVVAGKFGERWSQLAHAYQADVKELIVPWGQGVDLNQLAAAIAHHQPEVLFITHNESSTGVSQDIAGAAAICQQAACLIVVDAISSLGGAEFRTDAWGVDVAITGSQKCLMLPPGLSFLAVSQQAWERMANNNSPRFYFDLLRYRKGVNNGQAPYTPAVSLIFGLQESLRLIRSEGLENVWQRHRLMQQMIRHGLAAAGVPLFVAEEWASVTVTAALAPAGLQLEAWRKELAKETGIVLASGQDSLAGRVFRVGHMGYAIPAEMLAVLGTIEVFLAKAGYAKRLGAGVSAAQEVWLRWQ